MTDEPNEGQSPPGRRPDAGRVNTIGTERLGKVRRHLGEGNERETIAHESSLREPYAVTGQRPDRVVGVGA